MGDQFYLDVSEANTFNLLPAAPGSISKKTPRWGSHFNDRCAHRLCNVERMKVKHNQQGPSSHHQLAPPLINVSLSSLNPDIKEWLTAMLHYHYEQYSSLHFNINI